MSTARLHFAVLFAFALGLALSCSRRTDPFATTPPSTKGGADEDPLETGDGLTIVLRSASDSPDEFERPPLADAEPLSAAEVKTILARLPALPVEKTDATKFAKRSSSPPPPLTGATIEATFPPDTGGGKAPKPKAKALKVVRFAPEGDVELAPHLSISFNQPMVGITSHAELAAKDVPVKLNPTPEGRWRWVGTQTVMFSPDERFPMATTYEVEVPKGSASATGAKLSKAKSFTFTTPPPTLETYYPSGIPTRRQPLIFMQFNQRIDKKAVLEHVAALSGRKKHALRLAKKTEIEDDDNIAALVANAKKGRFLVVRPAALLPADRDITIEVEAGTPSAEGPRTTADAQSFEFRTYGPMDVERHECGYRGECPPWTPWMIQFTNPIELEGFDPSMVKVEPELPQQRVEVYGNGMYIYGKGTGRTKYTVTLSPSIPDTFDQVLGKEKPIDFRVTKAPQQLWHNGGPLVTLDPAGGRKFAVNSVNFKKLDVEIYAVTPELWPAYLKYLNDGKTPPGKRVFDGSVKSGVPRDEAGETAIDVSPALKSGLGHAIVVVEGASLLPQRDPYRTVAWVQATDIGLGAFVDRTDVTGWANDLSTGKPRKGVKLELVPGSAKASTDKNGLATLPLSAKTGANLLLARVGKDVAFVPQQTWWWGAEEGWKMTAPVDMLSWFVFDDRTMYKPGETVRFKGWVRRVEGGKGGDVRSAEINEIKYRLQGSRGNELAKGTLEVGRLGSFDGKVEIPDDANLGYATLILGAPAWKSKPGEEHYHNFQIQEFRRPEYEVTMEASEGPHRVGGTARLTASAQYYAGGALQNADVHWEVVASETSYTPPNRAEYTFGRYRPWWMWWVPGPEWKEPKRHTLQAKTDGGGNHIVVTEFVAAEPPLPHSMNAQATVFDVNRQAWTASQSVLVHPAEVYVGVKTARRFVDKGEPIELRGVVVDIDGKKVAGREVEVEVVRLVWEQKGAEHEEVEKDRQTCKAKEAEFKCSFDTKEGGLHRIRALVKDRHGNPSLTELRTWVTGGDIPQDRGVQQERVTLITDRDDYKPGDTAKVLVVAPFPGAHGVLTLRRSGLEEARPFAIKGTSTTLEVAVEERYTPNIMLQVDLVGAAARRGEDGTVDDKLPKRPAYATGSYNLTVPPNHREIAVEARPRAKKVGPGGSTTVDVTLKDHRGKPVADADVAVVVVDESVLALSGKPTPAPLGWFYGWRSPDVSDHHSRSGVQLARTEELEQQNQAPGGGYGRGGGGGLLAGDAERTRDATTVATEEPPPAPPETKPAAQPEFRRAENEKGKAAGKREEPAIALRTNFDALAVFEADARTDADGRTSVAVKVPDNLTRYRVMAVAAAGEHDFGSGEATITARLPLMVRPSPPRFLNFGDRFELPIVVQNQTDKAMEVKLAARATNLELTKAQGLAFTVPPNERREVRLPARTASAGTARFQVAATAGSAADAAMLEMPVWTPATTEAFASYGEIDKGAVVQPITAPRDVFRQFGGVEITTSSTAVSALTDAVLYLVDYPFECTEQIASRVLAVAALRDVLAAFDAEGLPDKKTLLDAVEGDMDKLVRRQQNNGAFGFWRRDSEAWPYLGVHVAHTFARAKGKGFKVPTKALERSKAYIAVIEKHIPSWYGDRARWAIEAYALHVRHLLGDNDVKKAKRLLREAKLEELPFEALGWLLPVLHKGKAEKEVGEIRRFMDNRATETAGAAHFADGYADNAHVILHSNRRADGIALEALVETAPKSDLIPKLVRGLLGHRKAGRWANTQETTFVLLALDAYFNRFEKITPNFVAKVWLGERYAGDHAFKGRTTERNRIAIPMDDLGKPGTEEKLVLAKAGKGRLYYRVGMKYAPTDLELPPADHGFAVERVYEPVDDDGDVKRGKDGHWVIKAGARVRVRVTMVAPARRYHVALVDPLPAGLEALNPALAVTGSLPQDPKAAEKKGRFWWWWGTWYEHQSMRDERAEAFASLLWEGVHEYTYIARATTPGEFVVPPAKAEEMYSPETFGRSAGDRVVVK